MPVHSNHRTDTEGVFLTDHDWSLKVALKVDFCRNTLNTIGPTDRKARNTVDNLALFVRALSPY